MFVVERAGVCLAVAGLPAHNISLQYITMYGLGVIYIWTVIEMDGNKSIWCDGDVWPVDRVRSN